MTDLSHSASAALDFGAAIALGVIGWSYDTFKHRLHRWRPFSYLQNSGAKQAWPGRVVFLFIIAVAVLACVVSGAAQTVAAVTSR